MHVGIEHFEFGCGRFDESRTASALKALQRRNVDFVNHLTVFAPTRTASTIYPYTHIGKKSSDEPAVLLQGFSDVSGQHRHQVDLAGRPQSVTSLFSLQLNGLWAVSDDERSEGRCCPSENFVFHRSMAFLQPPVTSCSDEACHRVEQQHPV